MANNPNSNSMNPVDSSNTSPPSNLDEYDGIFISPLRDDICNFPLPPDHKIPKFEIFNGEQDHKQHLISFQEECLLKLGSNERLMAKFFPRSLKDDATQ